MKKDLNFKILHIVSHLGGGMGSVLLNYFSKAKQNSAFTHVVACLDYANENSIAMAKSADFILFDEMSKKKKKLLDLITGADLVLMHWGNQPLMQDLLVRNKLPSCRLIIWSHISGLYPPYVFTKKILEYPERFVFTTPVSFETKEVHDFSEKKKKNLKVIWSTSGVEHVKSVKPRKHDGFNVGYIGTVDYAKMHPNFLKICDKINIPNVKFIVCGGANEKEIKKEADSLGIGNKFEFTGVVSDVRRYLSIFDVFGYPLGPRHYGTCEQVLAESMAAGVVPIVLQNKAEKFIIKDGKNGIIVKNEQDYVRAIVKLYNDKNLKNLLSNNARKYAVENFSLDKMMEEWEVIFKETMQIPKTEKKWKIIKKDNEISAKDIFLESMGCHGKDFSDYCNARNNDERKLAVKKIKKLGESVNWQSETKSTVHHFSYFFPKDKHLSYWSKLMRNNKFNKN